MTTFFKIPFAAQGDKEDIPLTTQADGSVSYAQGYGIDYERDYEDDLAKDIPRKKENKLFHDMTEAIGEMQQLGLPKWNTDGKPYPINTVLSHDNKAFISLNGNNNVTPVNGVDWLDISLTLLAAANKVEVAEAIDILNDKVDVALANKADKTTKLSAGVGLEGGGDFSADRSLKVKYGTTAGTAVQGNDRRVINGQEAFDTLPQSLATKADKTIKLSAGAGLEGGGDLTENRFFRVKYGATAGTAVQGNDSRLNQILGVGQTWVNVTASRGKNIGYVNDTGRPIYVSITHNVGSGTASLVVDGLEVSFQINEGAETQVGAPLTAIVPNGSTYNLSGNKSIRGWFELR